jgi:nitrite reductase/ring-hydroxylating ferredoxin subunit
MKTSGGEWKAWEPVCPHERAGLKGICPDADGYIVCPLHRYRFSLSDGYESQGRGRLYLYPVEERESGLYISI